MLDSRLEDIKSAVAVDAEKEAKEQRLENLAKGRKLRHIDRSPSTKHYEKRKAAKIAKARGRYQRDMFEAPTPSADIPRLVPEEELAALPANLKKHFGPGGLREHVRALLFEALEKAGMNIEYMAQIHFEAMRATVPGTDKLDENGKPIPGTGKPDHRTRQAALKDAYQVLGMFDGNDTPAAGGVTVVITQDVAEMIQYMTGKPLPGTVTIGGPALEATHGES